MASTPSISAKPQRIPSPLPGPQPITIKPSPLEQVTELVQSEPAAAPQPVTSAITDLQHALGYGLPAHLARAQDATGRLVATVARG